MIHEDHSEGSGRNAITWSPRVPKYKLRKLYQLDAQGIYDEDFLNDVGWTLYLRCRDILTIHQALEYRKVLCPVCAKTGQDVWIKRDGAREALIQCPQCGWEITWIDYHRSFKRRQLNPGGAVTYFEEYLKLWAGARTPKEKNVGY